MLDSLWEQSKLKQRKKIKNYMPNFFNLTIFKKSHYLLDLIRCYRKCMTVENKGCIVEEYVFKNLHTLLAIYLKEV